MMALRGHEDKSENTFLSTVPTVPRSPPRCSHRPREQEGLFEPCIRMKNGGIFFVSGEERWTSIFHPDGKQGTHLKVAALAPAVAGRTKFGEDLSGMSDSSIYQRGENWRVKMRCQQDEAGPEVKAENHRQKLPRRGPWSVPGPRLCEDFGEEGRHVRACLLHVHKNPSLHLHLTGRWRALRRARCTDQWLRSSRADSYGHTLRPILHD